MPLPENVFLQRGASRVDRAVSNPAPQNLEFPALMLSFTFSLHSQNDGLARNYSEMTWLPPIGPRPCFSAKIRCVTTSLAPTSRDARETRLVSPHASDPHRNS